MYQLESADFIFGDQRLQDFALFCLSRFLFLVIFLLTLQALTSRMVSQLTCSQHLFWVLSGKFSRRCRIYPTSGIILTQTSPVPVTFCGKAQVKTFDGFVKPSGLCVANDQLVVADRGAHQAHSDVWRNWRSFFSKWGTSKSPRNGWFGRKSMFFVGF